MANDNPFHDFKLARELGPLALLRLRAEALLRTGYTFAPADREALERICAAPQEDDDVLLGAFDSVYEAQIGAEKNREGQPDPHRRIGKRNQGKIEPLTLFPSLAPQAGPPPGSDGCVDPLDTRRSRKRRR